MKIFITGVAGFLGSHLADRMLARGHIVVGVDNLLGGDLSNVNDGVDFHKVDCIDIDKMRELMSDCDVVYHAACTAHEGLSVFSPFFITQNTFQITMSVLSAAIYNKVTRFIYCSSMSRYGYQENTPYTEDMVCNPQVPYAVAKLSSEKIIEQLCKLNDIDYVILVPHNIIGPRQKYDDPFRNVAAIMINRMLQGKQPIIYGDGEQVRCFSHIDDVLFCMEEALFSDAAVNQIINVGPDEEFVTINELATTIADIMDFELAPIYVRSRPYELNHATCSAMKARELLGYKTETILKLGLEQMVNFIKEHGAKDFIYNYELEINNEKTPDTWKKKLI